VKRAAALIAVMGLWAGAAEAAVRFPPPEFDSGYVAPETATPGRHVAWYQDVPEYVDVAVLAGLLILATVFALKLRSRLAVFLTMLAALLYLGFYREGCVCPIGAIQNVADGIAHPETAVPVGVVIFFLLPLGMTLLFGRTFCGAVCPLGAVQDATLVRPVRVPRWLEHSLGLAPYLYLGAAVMFVATGTSYIICRYDPFVAIFRLVDLPQFVTTGGVHLLALTGVVLAVGLFVGRPYCRFLCPYGAILRVLSRVSWKHVTITPDECVHCTLCEDACPYNAIRKPTALRPASERTAGKRRLTVTLIALPLLIVAGGGLGRYVGRPMAGLHRTVKLAEMVRREDRGLAEKASTDETEAFWGTGRDPEELYAEAEGVREMFAGGGQTFRVTPFWTSGKKATKYDVTVPTPGAAVWFGAFVGFVIGSKLVHLSIRRRRVDYEPDRATCVSCARCFKYCPVQRKEDKAARSRDSRVPCGHEGVPALAAGRPASEEPSG
jgi:ferredoxin